ncbi:MAG: hypothetical protein EAZ30_08840 [Betaproteobacteria bacterium]|nr:MAG: hypothetical protein EAZ43_16950 [Betaproteobacteria bacterium]TAG47634.1 MAG: hypothetical protein EAZ30_08840 [Betaproteobacteria bacterium]
MKDFNDDPHLDVCQNIEAVLINCYRTNAQLTDAVCEFALHNVKIAIKQHFGFAQNERVSQTEAVAPIVTRCVDIGVARIGKINDLTLKEFVARIDKIKASVRRHSYDGPRAYFEFVSPFFPGDVPLIINSA